MQIPKPLKTAVLSSAIFLGGQTTVQAQEQNLKPVPNNPKFFTDPIFEPKPDEWNNFSERTIFSNPNYFKNPDFQRPLDERVFFDDNLDFGDEYRSRDNEGFLNVLFIFGGLGVTGLILFLAGRYLINYTNQKSEELEETLRFVRSNKTNSVSVRKQSAKEREVRNAILKILKQRGGIDPSVYK